MAASKNPQTIPSGDKLAESLYQRSLFFNMALNMTWQLALVVLIPIVGGYELDKHFKTLPVITVIGAVIAALGIIAILRQTVKQAAVRSASFKGKNK